MTHVTCRLTAKNRDQLRNPTLGNRAWATFTFFILCELFIDAASVWCTVYVTVGCPSVRPFVHRSVCPVAAWAQAADIDRQLPAPRTGCRSVAAAGARAAAAGSVMLRAEVRGLF